MILSILTACKDDDHTPAAPSALVVDSEPSGAFYSLEPSPFSGYTPDTIPEVDPGTYVLRLFLQDHVDWSDTITLRAGPDTSVNVVMVRLQGSVFVNSTPPGASIWIDSVNTGSVTPDTITGVPVGRHEFRLMLQHYREFTQTLEVFSFGVAKIEGELRLLCPGGVIGNLTAPPEISFANIVVDSRQIRGAANNVDAAGTKVVLWALTNIWYVQPLIAAPFTTICDDGSWMNTTHSWKRMVALLVNSAYQPGSTRLTHPGLDPGVLAWVEFPPLRPDMPVQFSGHSWGVKVSEDRFDPGPNYWSAGTDNIWTDAGGLHLRLVFQSGKWLCPEVYLLQSLGYGTYTFQLGTRVDSLDPNAVFAGFIYESLTRELDIEFSSALAGPNTMQYVVQPYTTPGNILRFDMSAEQYSTHQIVWEPTQVTFRSWRGLDATPDPDSVINVWVYTGSDTPPAGGERFRFNLWLFGGQPPASGIGNEVIIRFFSHSP